MSRIESTTETDLAKIRAQIGDLGEATARALANATNTLILRDEALAYQTVLEDNPINRASRSCDRMCHEFIARHLPSAGHLRQIAAMMRVNISLERIGDYAVTIAREAMQLSEPLPEEFLGRIESLADECFEIFAEGRACFQDHNGERAGMVSKMARSIEARSEGLYASLFAADDRLDGRTMMVVFVVFNLLKRVADQTKNICEQTIYMVSGVAKVHKRRKFLFLDRPGFGQGHLALAIARKFYSDSSDFTLVMGGAPECPSIALTEFLQQRGLGHEDQESAHLADVQLEQFDVVISLAGPVKEYVGAVPFHTSCLVWTLPDSIKPEDISGLYRHLMARISELISTVVGD
jgi:phosphate transport system protein